MRRTELRARLESELGSAREARWLIDDVLGPAGPGTPADVDDRAAARVTELARRRQAGEPLQYVLGHWAFRTLDVVVDRRVLIPRPETEQVVERALLELAAAAAGRPDPVVVDLGTGSGVIALSVALEAAAAHPGVSVWAVDDDAAALAVASINRDRVGVTHPGVAERVRLRLGRWFEALPDTLLGGVALLVSNPPYVAESEWAELDPEVRLEPRHALVGADGARGAGGMADVEAIVDGARRWLTPAGALVVEIAPHQATAALDAATLAELTTSEGCGRTGTLGADGIVALA